MGSGCGGYFHSLRRWKVGSGIRVYAFPSILCLALYAGFQEPPMAVVENVTPSECKNKYELQIKQIREITGADNNEAWNAFKEGSFDIPKAIHILLVQTEKEKLIKKQPEDETKSSKSTDQHNVIDLTGEKDKVEQDIEKAIALSLQEAQSTNLSNEQRDITRALKASFNDSRRGNKRTRTTDFWQSVIDANPHEKKRCKNYPVGLRNVGNTCWFSAVVQSLFHIPAFRKNILNFSRLGKENEKDDKKLKIVKELQKLFAFMIGSRKKYIDPSNVIQSLTDFFKEDFNQQDVSEFLLKLIDCLEGTFTPNCSTSENPDKEKPENPVVEMFYGQYTVEGMSAGKHFTKEETFGAYPLQIESYGNLHECIEGAMVQNDVELAVEETEENTYTQELHLSKAFVSRRACRGCREEYLWFTRLPAVLILQLSRFRFNQDSQQPEKIHNKLEFEENMYMDCYMQDNRDTVRDLRKEISNLSTVEESSDELPPCSIKSNPLLANDRAIEPMEISDSEESPAVNKPSLDSLFAFQGLPRKVHYKLHAVLVHEGEANGGHYWAFIYDTLDQLWRKYNDTTVSDVTWEDVVRGSLGGFLSSSAYCLIYTESNKSSELFNNNDCHIAEKLRTLVEEDNNTFEEELKEWDRKQVSIVEEEKNAGTTNHASDPSMETENVTSQSMLEYSPVKKNHRLNGSSKMLNDVTNLVSSTLDKNNLGNVLVDWCNKERQKLKKRCTMDLSSTQQYHSDIRLEHKAIYMITCDAPDYLINRAIVETFLKETGSGPGKNEVHGICEEASSFLQKEHHVGELTEYKTWTEHYSTFQKANLSFINALDHFCDNKYHDTLCYLTCARKLNSSLPRNGQLNNDFVRRIFGLSLWNRSEEVFQKYTATSDDDAYQALEIMMRQVIPYMGICECSEIVDRIRDKWLTPCLEKPRQGHTQTVIEEFLQYLFEGKRTNTISEPPLLNCELDCKLLSRKYSNIMKTFHNSSHVLELTNIK